VIQAGRLDRRIRLMQRTVVRDADFGGATESWTLLAEVWAQSLPARGMEAPVADEAMLAVNEPVAWRIRWRDDLSRVQQVEWDGRRFVIRSIREISRRNEVIIEAIEKGAE
jgi:SPP1 family predicted phage head-tail adaptor